MSANSFTVSFVQDLQNWARIASSFDDISIEASHSPMIWHVTIEKRFGNINIGPYRFHFVIFWSHGYPHIHPKINLLLGQSYMVQSWNLNGDLVFLDGGITLYSISSVLLNLRSIVSRIDVHDIDPNKFNSFNCSGCVYNTKFTLLENYPYYNSGYVSVPNSSGTISNTNDLRTPTPSSIISVPNPSRGSLTASITSSSQKLPIEIPVLHWREIKDEIEENRGKKEQPNSMGNVDPDKNQRSIKRNDKCPGGNSPIEKKFTSGGGIKIIPREGVYEVWYTKSRKSSDIGYIKDLKDENKKMTLIGEILIQKVRQISYEFSGKITGDILTLNIDELFELLENEELLEKKIQICAQKIKNQQGTTIEPATECQISEKPKPEPQPPEYKLEHNSPQPKPKPKPLGTESPKLRELRIPKPQSQSNSKSKKMKKPRIRKLAWIRRIDPNQKLFIIYKSKRELIKYNQKAKHKINLSKNSSKRVKQKHQKEKLPIANKPKNGSGLINNGSNNKVTLPVAVPIKKSQHQKQLWNNIKNNYGNNINNNKNNDNKNKLKSTARSNTRPLKNNAGNYMKKKRKNQNPWKIRNE